MGDNIYVIDGCKLVTHNGVALILRRLTPDLEIAVSIEIGSNVNLDLETIVLPRVENGNSVVIDARSVVSKEILDNC